MSETGPLIANRSARADESLIRLRRLESRNSTPVGGLLFRIRGVLYDASCWQRWLLQLLTHMGLHTHYTCFFRVWEREYLPSVFAGTCSYWQALRKLLSAAGMSPGQIDEVIAAGHIRKKLFGETIRPLPGVRGTLARLAGQGVQLSAWSSVPCPVERVVDKLNRLGLAHLFPVVITASESSRAESEQRPWESAAIALQLSPPQLAFISSDTSELALAQSAGLQTVAFNAESDAQADYYLDQFSQLPSLLRFGAARMLAG